MIGAASVLSVTICLPECKQKRKQILRSFGVTLVETDPLQATDGAQIVARELFANEPEKYFYPDQYNNPANWRAHYESTAPEIWEQTAGSITHFIAGLGTSGTFVGTSRRLKERSPAIRVISMPGISLSTDSKGLKPWHALVPGIMIRSSRTRIRSQRSGSRCRSWREKKVRVGASPAQGFVRSDCSVITKVQWSLISVRRRKYRDKALST